ncbi:GNAT family N-acetyltransferase [Streptococcus massiliensis]|uniref:GNAT family N-acetyltransferase n=1 Tax=Streptococcus massiliensis TaxID=313439 RepID=UPI001F083855|nr:GNAT family N-acetyltransferase [Streptococcus massiliensis]
MLCAILDERIVGAASLTRPAKKGKLKHRAIFAIALDRKVWGKGLGRTLTEVCINCAKEAAYLQLELEVVASNQAALALYKSVGFVEYGRNPKAFLTRKGNYQETLLMRLELDSYAAK